ncbi:hypothetical protein CVU76_01305 [Candidatus Dojkabacteria bacterium HGW-Dojkabacteria-1]|uniref:Fibronectin type-III domain-containing protein n=1 Tax=Candidatus Dojkabacteria bacterium HGW-Dojkabacteria-1 TaxID=2013761 RepID=A0A2N2F399_9BACT|nr:MAG: hypothetical protein CVU76_01305 [Candidatus Dojkabacteria bacterium HGW-Dojkabacteria-1]
MRIKTAILQFCLLVSLFLFVPNIYAQLQEDVVVTANINVDFYSTVNVNPSTVEIFQPSIVEIRVLNPNGQGIPGRQIVIVAPGLNITQPITLTDATGRTTGSVSSGTAGTYTVCAKDTTFGYDIDIQNCKTLYVIPVPVPSMLPEPQYTKGLTNTVLWQSLGTAYRYNVQVSEFSNFSVIKQESGVINATSFEFTNLENGKMYFYRVRAQNLFGGIGGWSNSVYSVQDAQNPSISILDIGGVGENTTNNWSSSFTITMLFRVTDNLQLASTQFICLNSQGNSYPCTNSSNQEGDIFTVNIRLGDLERISGTFLRQRYEFCVEAVDGATNVQRLCNIYIDIPPGEEVVEPPVVPPIIKRVEKVIEDINVILDDTVGKLDPKDLDRVTTTTSVVTATSAIAIAAGGLGSLPYFLLQLFLNLLSLLGFRKGAKPVGFVYDSVTKEPISQAIVRIFNEESRIVWSDVTDGKGYFTARLKDGKYKIVVRAPRYIYPSTVVFGKEDYPVTNVYHGEEFVVSSETEINFAIPLDPMETSKLRLRLEGFWTRVRFIVNILHVLLFLAGITLAFYTYYNSPSVLSLVVLLLFVPTFFFILRNIFLHRDRYGFVLDKAKNRLEGVVIGLRESEFDKIVAKRVTDVRGRYRFLADEGRYYIEILDTGYKVESIKGGNEVYVKKEMLVTRDIVLTRLSK